MPANVIDRRPGQFAEERFRLRRRAWQRRIWWVLPLVVVVLFVPVVAIAAVINPAHVDLYVGLAIGAAAAMALCCLDSPPQHIERWRTGAEGEQKTACALRPLLREGWVLLNDLPRSFGNIDHVLIGPPGVFMLETKNLSGVVSVADDAVTVRWLEEPDDGYVNDSIGRRARGTAAELSRALGPRGPWVQAVVVLWARFEQGSIEGNRVLWTNGRSLADVLRSRTPTRLNASQIAWLAERVRASVAATPDGAARPARGRGASRALR
jgi:hypothetical protein